MLPSYRCSSVNVFLRKNTWISFMHKSKLFWQAEEEKSPEFLLHTQKNPKIGVAAFLVAPYTALIYPVTLRHFHSPGEV